MLNPLDNFLTQKVILLMTGVPGTVAMRDEISELIKEGDLSKVSAYIDNFMRGSSPTLGSPADDLAVAVQFVLDSGFSIGLTIKKIDQLIADSFRQEIDDSWTGLFSYILNGVDGRTGKILENRAEAAEVFTGLVDELGMEVNVNDPLVQEWIDKVNATNESLVVAKNTVNDLIDQLTKPPSLIISIPSDDSIEIEIGQNIILTFDKVVKAGAGDIIIRGKDGDTRTIAVTDSSQVTIKDNKVTINLVADLHTGTSYSILLLSGVITDSMGRPFSGISDSTTLDFHTVNHNPIPSLPITLEAIAEDSDVRVITQAELLGSASDVDGDTLTAASLAIASGKGTLAASTDGTWNYTPALNDDTIVSFSYTISDGKGGAATGSAFLDITPINDNPTTSSVRLEAIAEDSGIRVITQAELLGSASDVEDGTLTVAGLAIASGKGTLTAGTDGTWNYTPALNDDTVVRFSYTISDGEGGTATGSAFLGITPINDNPTIGLVTLGAIAEDSGTRVITQAELLDGASDVDVGDILNATGLVIASGNGMLVDNLDGTWSYTPDLHDDTAVSFSYTINDGKGGTVASSASLDILPAEILFDGDTVFVIDRSGSTLDSALGLTTPVGDQNGDGFSDTILDVEIASFKLLNQSLIDRGLGAVAKVSIVQFDSNAQGLDMEPGTAGVQSFTTPLTDSDSNGILDVNQALTSILSGSNTNYEAALQQAISSVNAAGTASGQGNVIFLSDGFPTEGGIYTDEANSISSTLGQNLRAFGIGTGANLTALQAIDPSAEVFTNPQAILDIFLF